MLAEYPELYVGDPERLAHARPRRARSRAEHPPRSDGRLPHADPPRNPLPDVVRERLTLEAIDQLTTHIVEATRSLQRSPPRIRRGPRLMSVPGVGPVTAIRFVAALERRAKRFTTVAQVQSYLGLTPGENSSSDRKRRTGITKADRRRYGPLSYKPPGRRDARAIDIRW